MVDIFDEISDDLRAERAASLLRRYGGLVIIAAVLVLLGVAAQQVLTWAQNRRSDTAAAKYLDLSQQIEDAGQMMTNDQRIADANALIAFAATAPAGYRTLARLRAAGLEQDAGKLQAAETLWDEVAADGAADPLLRQIADLLWAQHALGTAPDAAVAQHLAGLTGDENPLHSLARETQALMYLHEGKTGQAKALFEQISADPAAPEGVRNRALGLLASLNG